MQEPSKTNQELLEENVSLRQRIQDLEKSEVERKQIENALRESEAQKNAILNGIKTNIAFVDKDLRILWLNATAAESVNKSIEEMTGHTCHKFWADPSKPCKDCPTLRAFQTKKAEHTILHTPDGRIWDERGEPVFDTEGNLIGVVEIAQDITTQKQAEDSLRESEAKFRLLFNSGKDAIGIHRIGKDGQPTNFIQVNDALCERLGYTREEMLKMSPQDVDTPDSSGQVPAIIEKLLKNNQLLFETEHISKDGMRIPVEVSTVLFQLDGSQAAMSVARDITERRLAEEIVRKSEEKFYKAFHSSPILTSISTIEDGCFIDVNKIFLDTLLFSREEVVGKTSGELGFFTNPLQRQAIKKITEENGYAKSMETQMVAKDGRIINGLFSAEPITLNNEKCWLTVMVDVTEQKRAEEALRESEEKYRNLFENANDAIFVAQDGKLVFLNPMTSTMTGYSGEKLMARPFIEFIHSDDRGMVIDRHVRRMKGEELSNRYSFRIIHRDGNIRWVELNAVLINWNGKAATLNFMSDINERRQAEEALRLMNVFQDSILENIPNMIFIKDAGELRFVRLNRAGEDLLGHSRDQLLGKNDYDFFPKEQADFFTDNDREVLNGKRVVDITEEPIQTRNMGERILHTKKVPILNAKGEPSYLLGISEDITDRKLSEEKLKAAEKIYRNIFMNSQTGLFRTDIETGIMLEANDSMARFAGYENREELLSSNFNIAERYIDPEARRKMLALIKEYGQCNNYEALFRRNDGSVMWIRLSAKLVPDKRWLEGVAEDITDRKQMEDALRESEGKYRLMAENMADIISVMDMNLHFTYLSPSITRVRGFTAEEVMEQTLDQIMTPESLQIILAAFDEEMQLELIGTADPNRIRVMELEEYKKDGDLVWLESNMSFLRDKDCRPIAILAVSRDITDRKRAEKALRETQRRLSDIIEFLPDATLVIDRDGKVIAWNRAIESMTGVKAEEMLGKGNYEYAHPFYGERRPILIDLALHPDLGKEKSYTTIQRKGDIIIGEAYTPSLAPGNVHLSATASVLRDSRGEIIAAIECIRNNTDRKNMEERLQRAEKMEALGVLAGGVAHDMNNVLGVLVGYSELLLREVPEGSRAGKYAKNILQGGERAAAIIQDLLTMARRGVSVSEAVNLNQIVADSFKTPEFELVKSRHPDVQFRSQVEKDLFNIKGSPVHLSKTIMNLMSNAAESIRGTGMVTITTENRYVDVPIPGYENTQEGDYVVLTVTDTGSGISPEDMGRIFEPFYTKKIMGRSGTGLGLAVVWGTIKDHGGYIDVWSEENAGSTFTMYFPVSREALSKKDLDFSPDSYQGRGENILIVDDVEAQRSLAATILESLHYRVATAASGEDAVEYLRVNKTDLIVLDMIMDPGIDGLETYRRILEIQPRQKAIIVSGFAKTDRVSKAQELGAGEYVKKPYAIEKLGIAIRKELDRK